MPAVMSVRHQGVFIDNCTDPERALEKIFNSGAGWIDARGRRLTGFRVEDAGIGLIAEDAIVGHTQVNIADFVDADFLRRCGCRFIETLQPAQMLRAGFVSRIRGMCKVVTA